MVPYRRAFTLKGWLIIGSLIAYGVAAAAQVLSVPTDTVRVETSFETPVAHADSGTSPETVEKRVREYFHDIPLMAEVARCESGFEQVDKNTGSVKRGFVNANDVGVMQINERYHSDTAKKLGFDLHTLEGNLDYARYLYEHQGTQPWSASRPCWGNKDLAVR
jgi:hypothetical protein